MSESARSDFHFDLTDRVVLVTGAARGLGACIAKRAAAGGARLLLGDIRDAQGEALAKKIGGTARYLHLDVALEEDWTRWVDTALSEWGRIDALVNNAAILHIGTVENTPADVVLQVLRVNTLGPYLGIRAVLPAMKRQGKGAIVNIASIDGLTGMNGVSAYATSKWGLRGLTKSSAMELGRHGIRVNCVCPAGGNPEMYEPWGEALSEITEETLAYTENRAIPGNASIKAIADGALFLASEASRLCTGVDLPVDGGASVGHFIPGFNEI